VANDIQWFDMSHLGAALRVVPLSPLRGVAMTCFEITDRELHQAMYDKGVAALANGVTQDSRTFEAGQSAREAWDKARQALGFTGMPQVIFGEDNKSNVHRFYSSKTEFTLTELRGLVPALQASDLKAMSRDDIALTKQPDARSWGKWVAFTKNVLQNEAVGVWTPKANPFDKPFGDSPPLSEANPSFKREPFKLIAKNVIATYHGLGELLDRAAFRQNALVPYYSDLDAATADGWARNDLKQVELPYAIPLWVTKAGQIIALADVRYAPELMALEPEIYFNRCENGIIVSPIRDAKSVGIAIAPEIEKWMAWGAQPQTLDSPAVLRESLAMVLQACEELRRKYPRLPSDVSDMLEEPGSTSTKIKPLVDIDKSDLMGLVRTVSRYVPMTDDQCVQLGEGLSTAIKHGNTLAMTQATEEAKRKLLELAATVQSEPASMTSDATFKHVDAGEKIGGARKDFARRSIQIEDLESMNEMERVALVTKKNVWPALDYEQMRDSGVTPQAAVALKYLKDKLNTEPYRGTKWTPVSDIKDTDSDYIKAIAVVRDTVGNVKTLDDFGKALTALYAIGRMSASGEKTNYITGGTPHQMQWGRDASNLIFEGNDGYIPTKIRNQIYKHVDRWDEDAIEKRWSSLIKPKRERTEAELDENAEKLQQDRELHRPHLERVERSGEDWRGGRDITADDLIAHFGFRAIEFGKWLPQDERQTVLNMAFDSFCDLADALKIAPKDITLDGDLALAFGSRGRGGKHAALAHFESARNVINLTRLNGAGTLAHEWFHALDFHLGQKKGFASEIETGRSTVMGELASKMTLRPATEDEVYARVSADVKRGRDYTLSWLHQQGPDTRKDLTLVLDNLIAKAQSLFAAECSAEIVRAKADTEKASKTPTLNNESGRQHLIGRRFGNAGAVCSSSIGDAEEEMFSALQSGSTDSKAFKKAQKNIEANLRFLVVNLASATTIEMAREMNVEMPSAFLGGNNSVPTDYATQAKELDKTRSSAYWATTCELFARAGAAFVSDQIENKGARSDYLVFGADEKRFATHAVGNPNPTGIDRVALAVSFQEMIADYRLQCAKQMQEVATLEP
jgi:hypothetical protein